MYRALLERLGYSSDLNLAPLEFELEGDGLLDDFEQAFNGVSGERGDWLSRRNIGLARHEASHAMHLLQPETYPSPDSWARGQRALHLDPNVVADRALEMLARRAPEARRIVFVVDEVGQYVARDRARMLDLQGIAHAFQKKRGALWLIATSQETLEDVVDSLEGSKVELARVQDRFPLRIDLLPSDVLRVRGQGWSVTEAAIAAGVSDRTAYRWLRRFREQGEAGLLDRSSAPKRVPHKTSAERVDAIAALRRLRMTPAEIAELLSMPLSTVSAWLQRIGLGKRSRLEPPEPANRYELSRPGELVHVDVKRLGRISVRGAGHRVTGHKRSQFKVRDHGPRRHITGYEFVHVMVDDHSRLAYAEVFQGKGENARHTVTFLRRGLAFFKAHGVEVKRVMSDNGSGYVSRAHAIACRTLGVRHTRIRPGRPRTNGKAERFIQTLLNEWAYARLYGSSHERHRQLAPWLERYNFSRPHGSLANKPPGSRLTNVVRNNS